MLLKGLMWWYIVILEIGSKSMDIRTVDDGVAQTKIKLLFNLRHSLAHPATPYINLPK